MCGLAALIVCLFADHDVVEPTCASAHHTPTHIAHSMLPSAVVGTHTCTWQGCASTPSCASFTFDYSYALHPNNQHAHVIDQLLKSLHSLLAKLASTFNFACAAMRIACNTRQSAGHEHVRTCEWNVIEPANSNTHCILIASTLYIHRTHYIASLTQPLWCCYSSRICTRSIVHCMLIHSCTHSLARSSPRAGTTSRSTVHRRFQRLTSTPWPEVGSSSTTVSLGWRCVVGALVLALPENWRTLDRSLRGRACGCVVGALVRGGCARAW
jgi:hypothetical protein